MKCIKNKELSNSIEHMAPTSPVTLLMWLSRNICINVTFQEQVYLFPSRVQSLEFSKEPVLLLGPQLIVPGVF